VGEESFKKLLARFESFSLCCCWLLLLLLLVAVVAVVVAVAVRLTLLEFVRDDGTFLWDCAFEFERFTALAVLLFGRAIDTSYIV
jgi:predicted metal-binding membrane protein